MTKELTSKLVWWLASVASDSRVVRKPQVGDIVVETTHRMRFHREKVGLISAIGELVEIKEDPERGTLYTIHAEDGCTHVWENAAFLVVDRPSDWIPPQETKEALAKL